MSVMSVNSYYDNAVNGLFITAGARPSSHTAGYKGIFVVSVGTPHVPMVLPTVVSMDRVM